MNSFDWLPNVEPAIARCRYDGHRAVPSTSPNAQTPSKASCGPLGTILPGTPQSAANWVASASPRARGAGLVIAKKAAEGELVGTRGAGWVRRCDGGPGDRQLRAAQPPPR